MVQTEGPIPSVAAPSNGGFGNAIPQAAGPNARGATWFEDEPVLAHAGWLALRRIGRRARASWGLWVTLALVVSSVAAVKQALTPAHYPVRTLLRVSEGALDERGTNLTGNGLRFQVNSVAFSSEHLVALIRQHPEWFPSAQRDETLALTGLREATDIYITQNGFLEDRGSGDPARSAWIEVTYDGPTPEVAYGVAHALDELLVNQTMSGQRESLERKDTAARDSLQKAQEDFARMSHEGLPERDERLVRARDRWRHAEAMAAATGVALRGASARQQLRFDVVEPGRKPDLVNRPMQALIRFLASLGGGLLVGWLLFGAFDPRVVEAGDLEGIGIPVLGEFPKLPFGRIAGEGGRKRPRV
jgi:hypothetical protein